MSDNLLMQAFQTRYACKNFDPSRQISDKDFQMILEAGRLSPSSFGFEPWKFLVIQNKALRQKLFPIAWGAQKSLSGASHFLILLTRKQLTYQSDYIDYIMQDIQHLPADMIQIRKQFFENFQRHDFQLLDNERALFDWTSKQSYIALANMLTTAAYLGIDSCPIEGFNRVEVETLLNAEGLLDPKEFGVSVMAGFGYRNETPRPKTRRPISEIIQWVK